MTTATAETGGEKGKEHAICVLLLLLFLLSLLLILIHQDDNAQPCLGEKAALVKWFGWLDYGVWGCGGEPCQQGSTDAQQVPVGAALE